MKSSSYMAPSRIALMATLYWALHLPRRTTPNRPLPSSLMNVSSEGLISHFSTKHNKLINLRNTELAQDKEEERETGLAAN